jgi:hypothetical protein
MNETPKTGAAWVSPTSADHADLKALARHTVSSRAMLDVIGERVRQVTDLGYTADHDDVHADGSLSEAAAVFVLNAYGYSTHTFGYGSLNVWDAWGVAWFKPKSLRRDLVRAAALIIADIERIDRAAADQGARP